MHIEAPSATGVQKLDVATPAYISSNGINAASEGWVETNTRGQTHFVRHTAPPTARELLPKRVESFAAAPVQNPLSPSDYSAIWQDSAQVNTMFQSMQAHGTSLEYTPGQQTPANEQLANFLNNSRFKGIPADEQGKAAMAIRNGTAKYAKLDGRGFSVEYDAGTDEGRRITVLSPAAVDTTGAAMQAQGSHHPKYSLEYLDNRGYKFTNLGNEQYYTLHERSLPAKKVDKSSNDYT